MTRLTPQRPDPRRTRADDDARPRPDDGVREEIRGSLAEFVDCLRSGKVPDTVAERNAVSLAMVEAAVASAESGTRILLADVLSTALERALAAEDDPAVRAVLEGFSASR